MARLFLFRPAHPRRCRRAGSGRSVGGRVRGSDARSAPSGCGTAGARRVDGDRVRCARRPVRHVRATPRPARRRRRNRARSSTGHAVRIARADVRKLLARGDACAETRVDDRTDDCIEDHVRAPHRRSRGTISRGVRSARRRRRAGVVGSSYRSGTGRSQKNFPGVHSALGTAGASDARRGRVRTQACFIRRDIGDDASSMHARNPESRARPCFPGFCMFSARGPL